MLIVSFVQVVWTFATLFLNQRSRKRMDSKVKSNVEKYCTIVSWCWVISESKAGVAWAQPLGTRRLVSTSWRHAHHIYLQQQSVSNSCRRLHENTVDRDTGSEQMTIPRVFLAVAVFTVTCPCETKHEWAAILPTTVISNHTRNE